MITPGPWQVGATQWRRYGPPYKIAITSPSGTVANVLTHEHIDWHNVDRSTLKPNMDAKVVAAAPKMLELLEKLTGSLEYYQACTKPQDEWDEYDHHLLPIWLEVLDLIVSIRARDDNQVS